MNESASGQNPWVDDDRSLGSIRSLLQLALQSGHLTQDDLEHGALSEKDSEKYPSLRLINLQNEISESRSQLHKVNIDIQRRLQDKETSDLTHVNLIEKRIEKMNTLNSHLQKIVANKDKLIGRLQQPYVGDYIQIEASCKQHAAKLFPQLVIVLAELSAQLDNIEWSSRVDFNDGQLDSLLTQLLGMLANLQSGVRSLCHLRHSIFQMQTSGDTRLSDSVMRHNTSLHRSQYR